MKRHKRATHLAALCAFCICAGSSFGQSPASPPAPSGKTSPLSRMTLDILHATQERPLFSASRRPAPPPVVAAVPEAIEPTLEPEKPDVTLIGVIFGPGLKIGIFINESDKSLIRARIGESIRGWTLNYVDRRSVMLEKAQEHVKLELKLPVRSADTAPTAQESASPLHGTPVESIKAYATARRER